MVYKYEYEKEDDELNEEDDVQVMREVRKLVNSIWDWIECTEEVGSKFEDSKLPILDLKVYCVEVRLSMGVVYWEPRWSFYEKSMKSKYVIMEKSAMSDKVKATTLAQVVIRRMRNTHRLASKEERRGLLSDFAVRMKRSGYDHL